MPDVDAKLAAVIRQAKTTPMFFAFVAKGTNDGVLLVAKKRIPVKEINEAKAASGGKSVYHGRCVGEEGKLIFDVPNEPPATLAKQVKTVIHRDAGMNLQVEFRVVADLAEDEEPKAETTATTVSAPPPLAPPLPPPSSAPDGAARFAARFKALMPAFQKAEATGTPAALEAKTRLGDANGFFQAKDYVQANAALDQAEALIKQALASSTSGNTSAKPAASNVVYTQTRLAWDQTRKKIRAELQKLEQSILSACLDPDLEQNEFDFSTLAADTKTLYGILDNLDTRLCDKLDDALNAQDPTEKTQLQAQAGAIVKEYLRFVEGNELMTIIDENGFSQVAVRQTALSALHLLASKL